MLGDMAFCAISFFCLPRYAENLPVAGFMYCQMCLNKSQNGYFLDKLQKVTQDRNCYTVFIKAAVRGGTKKISEVFPISKVKVQYLRVKKQKQEEKMDNLREKISFKEKASYGLGDVACGLVYVLSCTFLTFFYTDGAGLNPAIIGSILMFSRLLDGVSDILVGYIVDRTKSKHGKARAWILRSSIPIAVCLVLTFTVPDSEGIWTYVYVAITYNLVNSVCYTLVNVPYGTLNSLMTRDQGQRMVINTFRMTMAQVGAMVTNMFTIPFINAMGGTSSKRAWIIVAVIYGIIAMIMLFICFFNTKERVSADEETKKENISLLKAFKLAAKNQYWIILVVVEVVMILGVAMSGTVAAYYAKYVLGNENIVGVINAINYAPAFILIPCLPAISARIGKRNIALIGGF